MIGIYKITKPLENLKIVVLEHGKIEYITDYLSG